MTHHISSLPSSVRACNVTHPVWIYSINWRNTSGSNSSMIMVWWVWTVGCKQKNCRGDQINRLELSQSPLHLNQNMGSNLLVVDWMVVHLELALNFFWETAWVWYLEGTLYVCYSFPLFRECLYLSVAASGRTAICETLCKQQWNG